MDDALQKFHNILKNKIKQHCYAYLIYERLRCGYSHEYWQGRDVTHIPPSDEKARISYIGRLSPEKKVKRMISFHLDYLISLAEHHVSIIQDNPLPNPSKWWIDEK